jgi:hypothetical protein
MIIERMIIAIDWDFVIDLGLIQLSNEMDAKLLQQIGFL